MSSTLKSPSSFTSPEHGSRRVSEQLAANIQSNKIMISCTLKLPSAFISPEQFSIVII